MNLISRRDLLQLTVAAGASAFLPPVSSRADELGDELGRLKNSLTTQSLVHPHAYSRVARAPHNRTRRARVVAVSPLRNHRSIMQTASASGIRHGKGISVHYGQFPSPAVYRLHEAPGASTHPVAMAHAQTHLDELETLFKEVPVNGIEVPGYGSPLSTYDGTPTVETGRSWEETSSVPQNFGLLAAQWLLSRGEIAAGVKVLETYARDYPVDSDSLMLYAEMLRALAAQVSSFGGDFGLDQIGRLELRVNGSGVVTRMRINGYEVDALAPCSVFLPFSRHTFALSITCDCGKQFEIARSVTTRPGFVSMVAVDVEQADPAQQVTGYFLPVGYTKDTYG